MVEHVLKQGKIIGEILEYARSKLNPNREELKWIDSLAEIEDEKHEDLLKNLFQGYALIDMFNSKRIKFEKDFWPDDTEIFSEIATYLKNVHDELQNKIKSVKL